MNEEKANGEKISFQAVIFDMDGTLIDSINADFLAWKRLFADYNTSLTFHNYIPLLGIRSFRVANDFLGLEDEEERTKALANKLVYFREIVEELGIKAIPYADDFIKHLKENNIPLALATSSRRAKMKMVMEAVDLLSYFDVVVAGEDVIDGKPAPDIFLKAASLLGVDPENCIVFEDAANGVKAAKNANMKCVALASEHTADLLGEADVVIDSFKDLNFTNLCERLKKVCV